LSRQLGLTQTFASSITAPTLSSLALTSRELALPPNFAGWSPTHPAWACSGNNGFPEVAGIATPETQLTTIEG